MLRATRQSVDIDRKAAGHTIAAPLRYKES
jgi:hypothetical protein